VSEYDFEPVRGLPGRLPEGEHILWQGSPEWKTLLRTALSGRLVAIYFALLIALGVATGNLTGAGVTLVAASLALGLMTLFAWASARSTVYTLTNKRVVLRKGVAVPKCFNLPLKLVASADLKPLGHGHGDIALTMSGQTRIAYFLLWPHARPWRLKRPQPMLRSVPEAEAVAVQLAAACAALGPIARVDEEAPAPVPAGMPASAAA